MNKVIAVGQACLDILHEEGQPVKSAVGGRIANMAVALSRAGVEVEYVSECATDGAGDMVVGYLNANGVGTKSIDRFTEGLTQLSLIFRDKDGNERFSEYVKYPDSRFDVLWPKIEKNDIVVFGSFFAVEESVRQQLTELLAYAQDRKAIIVYLPGFKPELCSRITRVMPAIAENLEVADVVIARESDMVKIFDKADPQTCYKEHIQFYSDNFLFTDKDLNATMFTRSGVLKKEYTKTITSADRLQCDATLIAAFVKGMLDHNLSHEGINDVPLSVWKEILTQHL